MSVFIFNQRSELTNLKLMNLLLEDGWINVLGKGDKERIVPLGKEAILHMHNYLSKLRPLLAKEGRSGGFVFLNRINFNIRNKSI